MANGSVVYKDAVSGSWHAGCSFFLIASYRLRFL
jgi:hypothetical protein